MPGVLIKVTANIVTFGITASFIGLVARVFPVIFLNVHLF